MDNSTLALWARMGGLAKAAKYSAREATAPARAAFAARWEKLVDPDGVLEPSERQRRADAAKRLHFVRLNLASQKSRRATANRKRGQLPKETVPTAVPLPTRRSLTTAQKAQYS